MTTNGIGILWRRRKILAERGSRNREEIETKEKKKHEKKKPGVFTNMIEQRRWYYAGREGRGERRLESPTALSEARLGKGLSFSYQQN